MSRAYKVGIVGLLVVAALGVMWVGTVLAQDETPTPAPATPGWHRGGTFGFGRGVPNDVALEAVAEVLGMTPEELSNRLWAGETLADLAEEAGVDLQDVRDAVDAAREQATREAIEQAVEDGELTREHADWLLEGLENGWWGGREMGGFGGHHGRFGGFRGQAGPGVFWQFRGRVNGAAGADDI